MKSENSRLYYLFSCLGVFFLSFYPLYMGVKVVIAMITDGTVMKEIYPKYIIPYTPICIAVIIGVLLMPLMLKVFKNLALAVGAAVSTTVFFGTEILLENKVVVTAAETVTKLQDWQMYMCYMPPDRYVTVTEYKQLTPIEILIGNYTPAFKLHFYIISLVLIISVLGVLYGFAKVINSSDRGRIRPLVLQAAATLAFAGLCILACFTAFWRDGNITVSHLSASLMTVFFILFGTVGGLFAGSVLLGKRKLLSIGAPALVSAVLTTLMYIGEMILLHGNLYILGQGWLFKGIPGIVLSPFDIFVILLSGAFTALISAFSSRKATAVNG